MSNVWKVRRELIFLGHFKGYEASQIPSLVAEKAGYAE